MSEVLFELNGVVHDVQPGWTLQMTANGRNRLSLAVNSVDGSFRPGLDVPLRMFERVDVVSSSVANPSIITTAEPHGFRSGRLVGIGAHAGSTPDINMYHICTVLSPTTFSIPVNVTVGGTGGWVVRSVFMGSGLTVRESGWADLGVKPIVSRISGASLDSLAERRYIKGVILAGTLAAQLAQIVPYLPTVFLDPLQVTGPSLPDLPCDFSRVDEILNTIAGLCGDWVWEINAFGYLRAFDPSAEIAPFDITDANGFADGDVTVEPTREGYANRVILRFTAVAIPAYAFLTTSANLSNGETVIIGSRTYTFQTVLTNVDGNVLIGATASDSLTNLSAAISLAGGAGTIYAAVQTINTQVNSYMVSSNLMRVTAITAGASGNSIGVSETSATASWITEGGGPTSTLLFGADSALTNYVIRENVPAQAAPTYIWEMIFDAPDITDYTLAGTTADAVLAVRLVTPKKVTYNTYRLGICPGQIQTINIADRNVNNTFLITDVNYANVGNLARKTITAIESSLLNSSPRWRDKYKQWSGTPSSGSGVSVAGGGGGGGVTVVGTIYSFGGSDIEWVQDATPTWISANSIQIRIDTTVRGSLIGMCYVRLRARSGNVTARLRNVSDGLTVGTSSAVASASFQTVSFAVALTAGSKLYEIQLLPSVANVDVQLGSGYME